MWSYGFKAVRWAFDESKIADGYRKRHLQSAAIHGGFQMIQGHIKTFLQIHNLTSLRSSLSQSSSVSSPEVASQDFDVVLRCVVVQGARLRSGAGDVTSRLDSKRDACKFCRLLHATSHKAAPTATCSSRSMPLLRSSRRKRQYRQIRT